jgi:hypothetical protein
VYVWTCRPPDKPGGARRVRIGGSGKELILSARALNDEGTLLSSPSVTRFHCGHHSCNYRSLLHCSFRLVLSG